MEARHASVEKTRKARTRDGVFSQVVVDVPSDFRGGLRGAAPKHRKSIGCVPMLLFGKNGMLFLQNLKD